ncbi:endonuclease/exonuclease/phosphatase family protein [Serratia rhizosphaerae]|uniref:Endonuclease/exonuclease/phosphatase family protein n=1 Tax=Serratia rhizosphaerae TaxID=2597702 RepID=A0ABX6GJQ7_9GAMM|nr:endonuclease/exonuclease/phosphatase family protein [Serratia rhizosphaerae]QHA86479.1 endonuclease/exonuclease/phosphatase family protein [Serratia rhizosphaerae]
MPKRTYAMRYVAGQPVERIFPGAHNAPLPPGAALPTGGALRVMVWNIFKQQRADWLSVLKSFGKDAQLVLLQEAQTTPELVQFATSNYLAADQVPAFSLPQHPSGVMTLAAAHPVYCCPLREKEPLLRLAKSALITVYPLFNNELLMVVNIHAVNFSLGVDVYSKQLGPIGEQIASHQGPVIMAGDFNAWSRRRINALYQFASDMALREVNFTDDHRRKAFGRPLDFVFYRDLGVAEASVLVTRASDHNPLLVEFQPAR